MKNSTFLTVISSAAAAMAAPTDQKSAARPFVGGPFRSDLSAQRNSPWGGSVQEGNGWRTVTGTTVIPSVTGQSHSAGAAAWVGIDGYKCDSAILQTGVVTWGDGVVEAWYEWWPEPPVYYGDKFPVSAGDQIRMSVNATSTTSGTSTLENLTTGAHITTPYDNMQEALCLEDAEWIVEFGGGAKTFANFGEWDFTDTGADGESGSATADGGYITNVVIQDQQYTDCKADSTGVQCKWV